MQPCTGNVVSIRRRRDKSVSVRSKDIVTSIRINFAAGRLPKKFYGVRKARPTRERKTQSLKDGGPRVGGIIKQIDINDHGATLNLGMPEELNPTNRLHEKISVLIRLFGVQ